MDRMALQISGMISAGDRRLPSVTKVRFPPRAAFLFFPDHCQQNECLTGAKWPRRAVAAAGVGQPKLLGWYGLMV